MAHLADSLSLLTRFLYKPKKKKEAVSGSSFPHLTRAKESAQKRPVKMKPLKEAASVDAITTEGKRFSVILIKEGLGNLKDCAYYTRGALQQAVADKIFEGKKLYVDHPSEMDEVNRPERSVRDVGGYFENIRFEVDGDRSQLAGDLVVLGGAAFDQSRTLIRESVRYADKHDGDLIGLSINANGDADEIPFDEFLKEATIPSDVMPKIEKARAQGATVVRVVKQIQSAVSCDLVTEAGAGGRVVKMLEQEKKLMAKKIVEAEEKKVEGEEKKEAEEKKEGEEADPAPADDAKKDPAHDDEQEDKDLIKKMMDKHLGADSQHDEADMSAVTEAYKMAKEGMGMEGEEAEKAACYSMKMAKHAQGKKEAEEKKEAEAKEAAAKEAEEKKEGAAAQATTGVPSLPKKEAEKVIALTAENAKLRESVKKFEVEKFLDKTLRESGLPMSATKEFRKLATACKSEKEITEKFQVFNEAYKLGGGEAGGFGFVITPEKEETDLSEQVKALTFEDCTK